MLPSLHVYASLDNMTTAVFRMRQYLIFLVLHMLNEVKLLWLKLVDPVPHFLGPLPWRHIEYKTHKSKNGFGPFSLYKKVSAQLVPKAADNFCSCKHWRFIRQSSHLCARHLQTVLYWCQFVIPCKTKQPLHFKQTDELPEGQ